MEIVGWVKRRACEKNDTIKRTDSECDRAPIVDSDSKSFSLFLIGLLSRFFVMLQMVYKVLIQLSEFYPEVVRVRLNLFGERTYVRMNRLRISIQPSVYLPHILPGRVVWFSKARVAFVLVPFHGLPSKREKRNIEAYKRGPRTLDRQGNFPQRTLPLFNGSIFTR